MLPRLLLLADDVFSQRTLVRELGRVGQVATVETLRDAIELLERSDDRTLLICDTRAALRGQAVLRDCDTSVGGRMLFLGGGAWDPHGAALAIAMRASLLEKPFVKGDVRSRVEQMLETSTPMPKRLSA